MQAFRLRNDEGNFFEIGADGIFQIRPVEACRGMIHCDTDVAIQFASPPVNGGYLLIAKELRHRGATQGDNDLRLDSGKLPGKIVVAGIDLFGRRVANSWWPAFPN